jgi:hypothetical protein
MDSVKFHVRHEHTKIGTKNSVPTLCSMAWLGGWISAKASSVRNGSRASSRVPLLTSPNRDPTRLRRAIAGSDPGVGNEKRQTKRSDDFHGSPYRSRTFLRSKTRQMRHYRRMFLFRDMYSKELIRLLKYSLP